MLLVCIHPRPHVSNALHCIADVTHNLDFICPDALKSLEQARVLFRQTFLKVSAILLDDRVVVVGGGVIGVLHRASNLLDDRHVISGEFSQLPSNKTQDNIPSDDEFVHHFEKVGNIPDENILPDTLNVYCKKYGLQLNIEKTQNYDILTGKG